MVFSVVAVTQIGLLLLVGLLGVRMYSLSRRELAGPQGVISSSRSDCALVPGKRPRKQTKDKRPLALDRAELSSKLHILAGLQERDCQLKGLNLTEAPQAVRTYATAWLYGASCSLCPKVVRHSDGLAGMVAGIASRKTGMRQSEAIQTISTLTSSSILLACYRAGLEGAEFWEENHHVPEPSSLYEAVTSNAFI
ncbi:MAG: hypothetical protein GYB26_12700 [Gammaproteobacteria bacterium]|uniref:Uncharacterized protein n=2 Tax=Marinobacter litoralis TaxID=187981 RepID=A0A3M2RMC7_9GAMM|nr:hypothetical protein [Gammaproteobacteria bacterium]RMJ06322.1 hypothetical protein DOQ08_01009 [Marinobacter litoralis]